LTSNDVIEQLTRSRDVLALMLAGFRTEDAAWKPDPDRWSALEIVNHLADIENEDFQTDLYIIFYRPDDPWPSFDIIEWVTERRYNERNFPESVNRFLSERNESIKRLKSLKGLDQDAVHSGNGFRNTPLKVGDILASWIAHDLFHLRQIALLQWDLLRRRSEPYSPTYSGFEN
jgi:hypothetical protein